jgi:RNA recognition motif-containing protein
MNIFVAKLNSTTTSEDLQNLFERFGEVNSAKVIFDRETGSSKGYGFVEMANSEEGRNAINSLNETEFDEREIVVKEARPKDDRGGGAGKSGGFQRSGGGGGFNRNGGQGGGGSRPFNRDRDSRSGDRPRYDRGY